MSKTQDIPIRNLVYLGQMFPKPDSKWIATYRTPEGKKERYLTVSQAAELKVELGKEMERRREEEKLLRAKRKLGEFGGKNKGREDLEIRFDGVCSEGARLELTKFHGEHGYPDIKDVTLPEKCEACGGPGRVELEIGGQKIAVQAVSMSQTDIPSDMVTISVPLE